MYDPRFEHDSCGVGFVADIQGRRSHRIVERALEAVASLTHRGAIAADARTGDGAPPQRFYQRVLVNNRPSRRID